MVKQGPESHCRLIPGHGAGGLLMQDMQNVLYKDCRVESQATLVSAAIIVLCAGQRDNVTGCAASNMPLLRSCTAPSGSRRHFGDALQRVGIDTPCRACRHGRFDPFPTV